MPRTMRTSIAVFLLSVTSAFYLGAQGPAGTISGTVHDQSGAVLPGVSVQIKNQETGRIRNATTDPGGRYRVTALELGTYEVQAGLSGFRTAVRPGVVITVGSEAV